MRGTCLTWNITALVQGWVSGAFPNQGLIMTSALSSGLTFPDADPLVANSPTLAIVFGPAPAIPEPSILVLLGTGALALAGRRRRPR